MILNTTENRQAFVDQFGCKDPRGLPYAVDDKCAEVVLGWFDTLSETYLSENLWRLIMQNRATFMLGEIHALKKDGRRYATIGKQVTKSIYEFVEKLSD